MANMTSIFRKHGKLTEEEVLKCIKEINNDIFYGTLMCEYDKSDKHFRIMRDGLQNEIAWWIEDDEYINYETVDPETNNGVDYKEEKWSDNYLHMRSVPTGRGEHLRWINEIMEKELVWRLDLTIYDEGIGYFIPEKYPKTFKEFIARTWQFDVNGIGTWARKMFVINPVAKISYKQYKKLAQENMPQDFVDLFIDMKIEKRNNKIDNLIK